MLSAPPAQGAYPGRDGKIAYVIASPWRQSRHPDRQPRRQRQPPHHHQRQELAPPLVPDGKLIAFERSKDIYIMTPTGTLVRRVTTTGRAHQSTWSPDGKRIAFVNVLANGHGDPPAEWCRGT